MIASFSVVILAAGCGSRMHSGLPKVLFPIGGLPILERIVNTVTSLNPHRIVVVYGYQGDKLKAALKARQDLQWALQAEQKGTGHAVAQALSMVGEVENVLILYGDAPLISKETLNVLLNKVQSHKEVPALGFVSAEVKNPFGFGRILRNESNQVTGIVEEKDATPKERNIKEINAGNYLVPKIVLEEFLPALKADNAQQEYYLTDVVKMAIEKKIPIETVSPLHLAEVLGVNSRKQLAELERIYQNKEAEKLMNAGVSFADPARFDLRGELKTGEEVSIDINVIIEGQVRLGNHVSIGPNVIIKHSEIHDGVTILANSIIEGAIIGAGCTLGPFARIRPGTELSVGARIGNFVEIKNATIGANTKINHLSYIGDASLGEKVNVGAGVITCNYDGKIKHHTIIGDQVFIGSDSQLIAPIRIGNNATIGAGTTVVHDVGQNELIHNKIAHRSVINWAAQEKSGANSANNGNEEKEQRD